MTPSKRWASNHRTEVNSRPDFEGQGVHPDPDVRAFQQGTLPMLERQVEDLRSAYDNDRNPAHVWHALMLLGFAWRVSGGPAVLPSWIAAYLCRAALEIQGSAVQWPIGDRHGPPDPDFPNWESAKGLTGEQRRDIAMEALGFKTTKGANPFTRARRFMADEALVREAEKLRAAGGRASDAVPVTIADKPTKLSRARKRTRRSS